MTERIGMGIREHEHIKQCRACGRDIVFLRTKKGKLIPVNAETVNREDMQFEYGRHVAHFSDCPEADTFRREQ